MDQIYKGLLSLSVILMFAAALIAAQARGHVPADDPAARGFAIDAGLGLTFDGEALRELDTLPRVFDTVMALPIVIELGGEQFTVSGAVRQDPGFDDSQIK